ncbi:hypothetical protein GQ473_00020 [archaeon]|nr:hypothetical protein [archaeon]
MEENRNNQQMIDIPYITDGFIKSTGSSNSEKYGSHVTHSICFKKSNDTNEHKEHSWNYSSITGHNAFLGLIQNTKNCIVGNIQPQKIDYEARLEMLNRPECVLGVSYVYEKDPFEVTESFYVNPFIPNQEVYELCVERTINPNTKYESQRALNAKFIISEYDHMYFLDSMAINDVLGGISEKHNLLPEKIPNGPTVNSQSFTKDAIKSRLLFELPENFAKKI